MTHPDGHHPRATHLLLPVPLGATPAPGALVWAGDLWVAGWSINETTGLGPATFQMIDGTDAGGVPMGPVVVLAANETRTVMLGGHLLSTRTGVFVRVVAGSVGGVIYAADK